MTAPPTQPRPLDPAFHRLVVQYVASLPDKLAALEQAMAAGRSGSVEGLSEAREIAHRMHGTAGCYGLRDLSDAAAVLEEILRKMKEGRGGSWTEVESAALLLRSIVQLTQG